MSNVETALFSLSLQETIRVVCSQVENKNDQHISTTENKTQKIIISFCVCVHAVDDANIRLFHWFGNQQ